MKNTWPKQRLDKFVDSNDPGESRTLLRYEANILICEALYPNLHLVEITLRNHTYAGIARKKGDSWLTNNPVRWMRTEELKKISNALDGLKKMNRVPDSGRVIAELNFGFWTSLFDRYYERKDHGADLWSGIIRSMFPAMPSSTDKISEVRTRLNRIRELRNRVFHYEPIWHWIDLQEKHQEILETIGWISPEIRAYAEKMDRFSKIYQDTESARKP